ncbi:unnamed protein product, partial [Rhizophagus irregularis]
RVKCFVELSTAEIYQSDKNPSKEDEKIKPWTIMAKYKYKAEEKLKTIEGNTDQEKINKHISNIFNIQTGFHGTITSNLAQLNLDNATDEINDKHMRPWKFYLGIIKSTGLFTVENR